jgi:hypothetical protein
MRVVVRTTTGSPADSTPATDTGSGTSDSPESGSATSSSTPADDTTSGSSTPGGTPAPPIGDAAGTKASATDAGTVGVPDAEGAESRPSRVPTGTPITCHGYSEGQHGLKLTDADGEQCGYVPYAQLLRVVPE